MNGYEKAVSVGLTTAIKPGTDPARGYTDAEIVAILQTLTTTDIIGAKLGKWLGERQLLSWDGSGWFGLLQTLIENGTITGAALDGIRELKAVLVGPRGDGLETTSPIWAPIVFQTIGGIAQVSDDAAAMIDSFYALDGGRPYKDLTAQEFAAQRTAAEAETAAATTRNTLTLSFHAYLNAIGTSEQADRKAKLLAALEAV